MVEDTSSVTPVYSRDGQLVGYSRTVIKKIGDSMSMSNAFLTLEEAEALGIKPAYLAVTVYGKDTEDQNGKKIVIPREIVIYKCPCCNRLADKQYPECPYCNKHIEGAPEIVALKHQCRTCQSADAGKSCKTCETAARIKELTGEYWALGRGW